MTTKAIPHCSRCGRAPRDDESLIAGLPKGWKRAVGAKDRRVIEAACPGCQFAAWHPTARVVSTQWRAVAWLDEDCIPMVAPYLAAMPSEEIDTDEWMECDYIGLTVSWMDRDELPQVCRCLDSGGSAFEGVHRDQQQSGLPGTATGTTKTESFPHRHFE